MESGRPIVDWATTESEKRNSIGCTSQFLFLFLFFLPRAQRCRNLQLKLFFVVSCFFYFSNECIDALKPKPKEGNGTIRWWQNKVISKAKQSEERCMRKEKGASERAIVYSEGFCRSICHRPPPPPSPPLVMHEKGSPTSFHLLLTANANIFFFFFFLYYTAAQVERFLISSDWTAKRTKRRRRRRRRKIALESHI